MRGKITIEAIETLKPIEAVKDGKRVLVYPILSDDKLSGFVARLQKSGKVSYFYRYRDKKTGVQHMIGLGQHGSVTPAKARELAKIEAGKVAGRRNPLDEARKERAEAARAEKAAENTVNAVLDEFEREHVNSLRSGDQIKKALKNHVRPAIGAKSIYDLTRADINSMLKQIRKDSGPVAADRVLAFVRKAFNWQMLEDEEFVSPVIRGMAKVKPKERARDRVLNDDEIRDIWTALDSASVPDCYRRYIKFVLLTITRRNEASDMHTREIEGDAWVIPSERYKSKRDHTIPLTPGMKKLLGDSKGFVFSTTDGARAFSGFSKAKAALDKEIAKGRKAQGRGKMERWTTHDLRRTGRTLMTRAKVPSEYAERCMGHVVAGVEGVYNRWAYLDEKRFAFEALAGLVERILKPPADNVVAFAAHNQ